MKFNRYDIRVKSLTPRHACMSVGERLNDPPHIEREVGRKHHGSARCGRSVVYEVRNASDISFDPDIIDIFPRRRESYWKNSIRSI